MAREEGSDRVVILVRDSLLARVNDSVGTRMFQRFYARVGDKKLNILDNGDRSCALFVSTVLVGFHLVKEVHATVSGTLRDMESFGWQPLCRPRIGCVIVWEANECGHPHIGFYVAHGRAISNSSGKGFPDLHPYKIHKVRYLYWHSKLD